jgi:predicted Zn-dependent protease
MQQSESGAGGNIDFLSTHPANAKRIEQIKRWLPEVQQIRADSCGDTGIQQQAFQSSGFFR